MLNKVDDTILNNKWHLTCIEYTGKSTMAACTVVPPGDKVPSIRPDTSSAPSEEINFS